MEAKHVMRIQQCRREMAEAFAEKETLLALVRRIFGQGFDMGYAIGAAHARLDERTHYGRAEKPPNVHEIKEAEDALIQLIGEV